MELIVEILEYTSHDFPFWVSCRLCDAYGKEWYFVEKLPVVSCEAEITSFPCKGYIRGQVLSEQRDMIKFCTKEPDGVESIDGCSVFWVSKNRIVGNEHEPDGV